jgi:BirA family transcriptional regulator, biotin operon repressor / biotin---[acetyl-CoA-carboxylase] ligase
VLKITDISKEVSSQHKYFRLLNKNLFVYRQVSSTNSIGQFLARTGVPEDTFILSSLQTSGMGRMKRQWNCPAGQGILMSMVLRPDIDVQMIPQLTLLCGVVAAEAIRETTGCETGIKWPNDIVINGKKVCGILAQCCFSRSGPSYVIMGVGINVNQTDEQLPSDCRETSTSLRLELGHKFSRLRLLERFIVLWDKYFENFLSGGHSFLRPKWMENNITLGRVVNINQGDRLRQGIAVDISKRGGLIVNFSDGMKEEFLAGDLSLGKAHYSLALESFEERHR